MEGIVASRNYYPGDAIYSERAFAKVVQRKLKDVVCEFCCKTSTILRACKDCLDVKYCDEECQKNDWSSSHKLECRHLKNLPKVSSADFVRLLGKVILKIKGRDWKLIKISVLGKECSFDDVDPHCKEMASPRMILFFNEMKELTGRYIGFDNLPDDDNLIKIVAKVKFGAFKTRSLAFFIGTETFGRECIPNSNLAVCGNTMRIWAFKNIKKGEDKITFPFQTIFLPAVQYINITSNPCKCADCCLPFGESVLHKIIDKKRAFTVIAETEAFFERVDAFRGVLSLPESEQTIDRLLQEQDGVLGDTNYLRMTLLSLGSLNVGGNPLQRKMLLLKLERSMRSVFGEQYVEMLPIYKALCEVSVVIGDNLALFEYAKKAMLIEMHLI